MESEFCCPCNTLADYIYIRYSSVFFLPEVSVSFIVDMQLLFYLYVNWHFLAVDTFLCYFDLDSASCDLILFHLYLCLLVSCH